MNVYTITEGDSPIILGQPHGGTHLPDEIYTRLNRRGQGLDDTDWHCFTLSKFHKETGEWEMEKAPVYHIVD